MFRILQITAAFVRSRKTPILAAALALAAGVGLSAGYVTVTRATSSQAFCTHACHEMERTVAAEYGTSRHHSNKSGTVVTCAQCHLPQDGGFNLMGHQIAALSRVWGHYVDREYLPGRFEARRPDLAKKVLAEFSANNARECKACHSYESMILSEQSQNARRDHEKAMTSNGNCLECHKGVTHTRQDQPAGYDFQ